MKITVYPADSGGCGFFRLIWAAEELKRQGHDIDLKPPDKRDIRLQTSGIKRLNQRRDRDARTEDVLDLETDVIVLQLLDPNELEFPFRSAARFTDVESATEITADPRQVRAGYLAALSQMQSTYERELRSAGIDFVTLDTSRPLDFALLAYLDARARRK